MSLDAVKEEVLSSAKAEASAIASEGKREASRILREADKKIEDLKEKTEAETKKILESMKRQETASAELEAKRIMLEAKKELVDKAFDTARKKLEDMEDKEREALMKKIMHKIKVDIDICHLYCSKKDARHLKDFKTETADISGGLIAENSQKTVRVDCSYETMLQSIRESKMHEINKILFQ